MFSFGARHDRKLESSPGPSYLIPSNITKVGRDGTPAFSLHSRPKEPQLFQAPGPGQPTPSHITGFVKVHGIEMLLISLKSDIKMHTVVI